MRLLILLWMTQLLLYATPQDIHAFLAKTDTFYISMGVEKVNDTLDVFNIKERELDKKRNNFTTLGDMEGLDVNMGYTFNKQWYLHINLNQKKLNYLGSKLTTKKIDSYLRYQFYHSNNWAFSVDLGYAMNQANDTSMDSVEAINDVLEDILPNKEIELKDKNNQQTLFYRGEDRSIKTVELKNKANVKVEDTYDKGFYTRAILSLKQKKWLFDSYLGYSEIQIHSKLDSSVFDEENPDLQKELEALVLVDKRKDAMFFGGMSVGYAFNDKWQGDLHYQYNHIVRIACLENSNTNHIFNFNLTYNINSNIDFYIGGKVMLSQFNGEIPYMYTKYNKGSFHHKYGFANGGIAYKF